MTTTQTQAPTVQQIALPEDVRSLATLTRIDYSDAFLVTAGIERSPEQWARATVEQIPLRLQAQLYLGWRALGLRHGPPWRSADRVLGWPIVRRSAEGVLLGSRSWLGMRGNLAFVTRPEGVLFATMIEQRNPLARGIWATTVERHQQIVRSLLTHAAGRIDADDGRVTEDPTRPSRTAGPGGSADGCRAQPCRDPARRPADRR